MAWCRRHLAGLLGAGFAVATTVILAGNISRSFDYDEGVSVASTISRGSATVPLTDSTVFNNHPLFSVGQSVWWALGGEGEARQRLLPVIYGVAAVAVLVWWVARRIGSPAAVAAGLVLMLNPMFVTESRDVRGYSLATLAVVVGVVALLDYVRAESDDARSGSVWLLVAHAAAVVIGLGTHLYAGVALGAVGVGSLFVLRRLDARLVAAWAAAAVGTALVYLPTFDELRATADARGSMFRPWFGRFTTWEVLGRDRLTATVAALVAVVGVAAVVSGRFSRRRGLAAAVVVALGLVLVQGWFVWQIVAPTDLYPRFFVFVVPLVALAVGVGAGRSWVMGAAVVVAMAFTFGNVIDIRSSTTSIREVAGIVRVANGEGLETCTVGGWPMQVYGATFTEIGAGSPDRLVDCDLFVRIGSWGRPLVDPARDEFAHESIIQGVNVFARVPVDDLTP